MAEKYIVARHMPLNSGKEKCESGEEERVREEEERGVD
jgi:hypothetical protein